MSKESFIIYTRFYKPISKMTNEQLGRLFRAIFIYQQEGVEEVDADIEMAFAFFVNQFEIDMRKYRERERMNRENGRKGGRAKAQKRIDGADGNATKKNPPEATATQSTKSAKSNDSAATANEGLPNVAAANTLILNENDNDNGNDNDNDNDNNNDNDGDDYVKVNGRQVASAVVVDNFFKDKRWLESFCRENSIDAGALRELSGRVVGEWRLSGADHSSISDARKHLLNHLRIKIKQHHEAKQRPEYDRRRGVDSAARTAADYTGTI